MQSSCDKPEREAHCWFHIQSWHTDHACSNNNVRAAMQASTISFTLKYELAKSLLCVRASLEVTSVNLFSVVFDRVLCGLSWYSSV